MLRYTLGTSLAVLTTGEHLCQPPVCHRTDQRPGTMRALSAIDMCTRRKRPNERSIKAKSLRFEMQQRTFMVVGSFCLNRTRASLRIVQASDRAGVRIASVRWKFRLRLSRSLLQTASFVMCNGPLFLIIILNVYSEYIVGLYFYLYIEPFGGSIGQYIG